MKDKQGKREEYRQSKRYGKLTNSTGKKHKSTYRKRDNVTTVIWLTAERMHLADG